MNHKEIFDICMAYESGIGHGLKDDHYREQFINGSNEWIAYRYGYGHGKDLRKNNEIPRFVK